MVADLPPAPPPTTVTLTLVIPAGTVNVPLDVNAWMVGIGEARELTHAVPLLVSTLPDAPTEEIPVPPYEAANGVVKAIFGVSPPEEVIGAVAVTLVTTPPRASAYTDLMFVTGVPPSLTMSVGLFRWITTLVPPLADAIVTVHGPVPPVSDVVL